MKPRGHPFYSNRQGPISFAVPSPPGTVIAPVPRSLVVDIYGKVVDWTKREPGLLDLDPSIQSRPSTPFPYLRNLRPYIIEGSIALAE